MFSVTMGLATVASKFWTFICKTWFAILPQLFGTAVWFMNWKVHFERAGTIKY